MSLHSDTLFWFYANQSFLSLRNAACLAEKQQIPIYRTLGEHANHYATDAIVFHEEIFFLMTVDIAKEITKYILWIFLNVPLRMKIWLYNNFDNFNKPF